MRDILDGKSETSWGRTSMGWAGPNPGTGARYVHEKRVFRRRTAHGLLLLAADGLPPLMPRGTALAISCGAPLERVGAEVETLAEILCRRRKLAPPERCAA